MSPHAPNSAHGLADGSQIVITGRGLVSALGLDVVTACAAFRAGLSRASLSGDFPVSGEGHTGQPLNAHTVQGITDGFEGPVRLQRLLAAGFEDLWRQTPELAERAHEASLYVALPAPGRELTGADMLRPDDPEREELLEAARAAQLPPLQGLAEDLIEEALVARERRLRFARVHTLSAGHASLAQACLLAAEELRRLETGLAFIAVADSLVDAEALGWLQTLRRLRTPQRPAGVVMGEACAILVLEHKRAAHLRNARCFGELGSVALALEPAPLLSGKVATGSVMAQLIDGVHRPYAEQAGARAPWVLLEHNGEVQRAAEWGNTLFHLRARGPTYADLETWYPATGFGDTGAASGGVAACIAAAAWERKYAPSDRALICSRSDGAERAVLEIKRPT